MRWLDEITDSMDMGLGGLQELVMAGRPNVLWFMGLQRVEHDWATELNWTEHDVQIYVAHEPEFEKYYYKKATTL